MSTAGGGDGNDERRCARASIMIKGTPLCFRDSACLFAASMSQIEVKVNIIRTPGSKGSDQILPLHVRLQNRI